jgi:hypothetical protein
MPTTYNKIASVTVGSGGAANITFSSIPATFTDLLLKLSSRSNRSDGVAYDSLSIKFNASSSSYSNRMVYGDGSSALSAVGATTHISWGYAASNTGVTANTFGSLDLYVPNYSGSTNKSTSIDSVTENNATAAIAVLSAGLWSDTSIINSIEITPITGSLFLQYSTATLYGIKKD